MEIRSAYGPKTPVRLDQTTIDPATGEILPGVSMTKQSFAEESEMNNIMAKYEKTGLITHVKDHGGYSDMPAGIEYQDALQMTIDAQLAFDELPAGIRKEFNNSPFEFLEFVDNPDNVERMGELGLLEEPTKKPPERAEEEETPPPEEPPPTP